MTRKRKLSLSEVIRDEFKRDATFGERFTFLVLLPFWYLAYRLDWRDEDDK